MNNESSISTLGNGEEKPMPNLVPRRKWKAKPPKSLQRIAHGQKSFRFGDPDSGSASEPATSESKSPAQRNWKLHTGPESSRQIKVRKQIKELKKRG